MPPDEQPHATQAPPDASAGDASGAEAAAAATQTAPAGKSAQDWNDILEHPYVKRLEDRYDKLEQKYEAQLRRTEQLLVDTNKLLATQSENALAAGSAGFGQFLIDKFKALTASPSPAPADVIKPTNGEPQPDPPAPSAERPQAPGMQP